MKKRGREAKEGAVAGGKDGVQQPKLVDRAGAAAEVKAEGAVLDRFDEGMDPMAGIWKRHFRSRFV
jgi:hypothetical protein